MSSSPSPDSPEFCPPAFSKISLPSSSDFSKYKNICFISSIVEDSSTFSQYLNADTYPVIYSSHGDRELLKTSLLAQFTTIERISFVFHGPISENVSSFAPTRFINGDMFFTIDETTGDAVVGENHAFIQELCTALHVGNVDFLGCNLLQSLEWKKYFALFQSNVVVGASLDNTGNLKYGGNWVMENTMENVRDIYLNSSNIDNFAGLLIQYNITFQAEGAMRKLYYTVDASNNASITGYDHPWPNVVIPATINGYPVTTIASIAFSYAETVVIPVGVTKIGSEAVRSMPVLVSVSLPEGLTYIGQTAFYGSSNFTTINLPDGLTYIGANAFGGNPKLGVGLDIPSTVTYIGDYAFWQTGRLTNITIPGGLTYWGEASFANSSVTGVTIGHGITTIPVQAFYQCGGLTKVHIPNTVTTINYRAFMQVGQNQKILIPSSVTNIVDDAFRSSYVDAIYFCGSSIPVIGAYAFMQHNYATLYHLSTVTSSVASQFQTFANNNGMTLISKTPSQMFDQMKLDNVTVLNMYNSGLFTMTFLKTQYTIQQMYAGGVSVAQLIASGSTIAEILAAIPSVTTTLSKIIRASASAYVPTIPVSTGATVDLPAISTLDLTDTAIIGSTVAEQKSFTSATVKSLFTANTAQKQLVLPIGSILPGFSQALTTEVYLINASSSVTNNKVAVLPKTDILNKTFYVLLEAGDAITLQTNMGTVAVSKTGSTFTLTPSTGSAVTKVAGDTYFYDGLSIALGSVYGTLKPTNVNFVLTALNSQFQLSTAGAIPIYTPTLTSDAVITLNTTVSADVMQNTFFYRTDRDITLDASFVYYYVDSSKWTNQSTVLNPKNGVVTTNMYVAEDGVGKDFLRDLAKQLFGTYLGADLFTNEDSVITDIHAKCDSVATYAVALINSIDKTAGTSTLLKTDLSGGKYLDDNVSTSNISRELFNQLITAAPTRFTDTKPQKYNAEEDGFYKLPILQGDTITFKMTIAPSTTQTTAVPTGPTSLLSRSYKVVMNVGGT